MAGVRNLTQIEAAERARLLDVTSYDITIDLTDGTGGPGDGTFRSTTVITFSCTEPGASTFIEAAMDRHPVGDAERRADRRRAAGAPRRA